MGGTIQSQTLPLTLTRSLTLILTLTRQVRDVAISKRGQAALVEGTVMSRCNQFGISPLESSRRVNLRTMSVRARERIERRVDERHG